MKAKVTPARVIDVLNNLVLDLEHYGPSAPEHVCGPQSPCDMSCQEYANYATTMNEARQLVRDIVEERKPVTDDLEVPHQKIDKYARTPSALREMPNY